MSSADTAATSSEKPEGTVASGEVKPKPMRKIKVYTRTGDKGSTSLYNMKRFPKDSDYFEALGDTDELNAHIGMAMEHCQNEGVDLAQKLEQIQSILMDVGSNLATPISFSTPEQLERCKFDDKAVFLLEQWIDEMEEDLPPLRNFVLPSGSLCMGALHVCRAVTRRAERHIVPLVKKNDTEPAVMIFMNRLSDFFFVASRWASLKCGKAEKVYKKALIEKPKDKAEQTNAAQQ